MKALSYQLHLLEPVLATGPGGDPNTESSLPYIPGSVIRGALAQRYLQVDGNSTDAFFDHLFLTGDVRYLNAYPLGPGSKRALPTPVSWVTEKDDQSNPKIIYDRTAKEPSLQKRLSDPFVSVWGTTVIHPKVEWEVAIHTSRNREKGRAIENDPASAVYRYRALARGQTFGGMIILSDASEQTVEAVRTLLKDRLVLGGSRSAGYGLVEIRNVRTLSPLAEEHEQIRPEGTRPSSSIAKGESFIIYLTADAILRDPQTGRPTTDIRPFLPIATLEPSWSLVQTTWVGGFNATWELPLPQEWAVRQGSLWELQADADFTSADIQALEQRGIGARTSEGFGSLLINPGWPQQGLQLHQHPKVIAGEGEQSFPALDRDSARLVYRMRQQLTRRVLDRQLMATAQVKADTCRGPISKSQLARLRLRIRRESGEGDFNDFRAYLQGTHTRKSADDQFRNFQLGGKNFREWLEQLAQNPHQVWDEIIRGGELNTPRIGAELFPFRDDGRFTHEYTIRYIDAVCEQLTKRETT